MKWFEALRDFWMGLLSSPDHNETNEAQPVQEESNLDNSCSAPKTPVTYPSLYKARHGKYTSEEWWMVICQCNSIGELHMITDVLEYCIADYTQDQILQFTRLILRRSRVIERH